MPRTAPSETLAPTPQSGAVPLLPGTAFSRAGVPPAPGRSPAALPDLPDRCKCYDCGIEAGWFAFQWRGPKLIIVCHKHFVAFCFKSAEEKAPRKLFNGRLVVA